MAWRSFSGKCCRRRGLSARHASAPSAAFADLWPDYWLLSGVMATVVTGFSLFRPSAAEAALESEVGAAIAAPAADRLRDPVGDRIKEWAALQENPAFAQLPAGLKRAVASAAQEAATYQELLKKVDSLKRVRFFRNDDDIIFYKKAVDKIVVPAQYAADWMTTRLAKRLVQYRSELEAVATALALEKDWLTSQQAIGDKLLRMAIPGAGTPQRQEWINNADIFLRGKDLTKPVPHVTNMKLKELYDFPSLRGWRRTIKAPGPAWPRFAAVSPTRDAAARQRSVGLGLSHGPASRTTRAALQADGLYLVRSSSSHRTRSYAWDSARSLVCHTAAFQLRHMPGIGSRLVAQCTRRPVHAGLVLFMGGVRRPRGGASSPGTRRRRGQ